MDGWTIMCLAESSITMHSGLTFHAAPLLRNDILLPSCSLTVYKSLLLSASLLDLVNHFVNPNLTPLLKIHYYFYTTEILY